MTTQKEISISSARSIKSLTFSDSTDFTPRPRGVIVANGGDIVFVNEDDTTTTVSNGEIAIGVVHPISPKRINSTGTTATKVYGVY